MKKIFFLGICVISNILVAYAQPTNIDFNSGNINGWTYTEGGNLDSYLMTMSNPTTSTQYSVMTAGATETNTVPVTMNSPLGGNFIRMGLANTGGNAYKLTQTFRVTSASQGLAISYAVILQDGNHTCNEQPYFNFVIKDSVGNVIGNSNSHYSIYSASCSSGDPSFITSGSFGYKNWINSSFSLSNYVSTNVTVEYMVSGCVVTQGGHIGYAYVDASICNNSFSPNILSVNTNTYNLLQSQNNILVCGTTTADIVAPPGATSYSWTGAGISGLTTQSVSITQTGTYSLVFDNASACSNTTGVTFTVGLNPIVSITASSNTVCANGAITMTATGGSSYSWTPVVGSGNYFSDELTVNPTSSTVYTAITTGTNGCSASAQYSITVAPSPSLAVTGNTNVCLGNSTLLTATGADTYTWTVNGALTNTMLVTPTVTTNYYVTGKITSTGCTQTFVTPVTVNGNISITPAIKKICVGDSIFISASGATSYTWSSGANTNTVSLKPTATTNYTLFWETAACGTYSNVFTVTVNPLPNLSITNSNPVCSGKQMNVATTFSSSTTYTWSNGATTVGTTFTPSASIVPYTFTCSVSATNSLSCKNTATTSINVNPSPVLNHNFPPSLCSGSSFTLNFSGANTYTVNALSLPGSTLNINPVATTNYTLTGKDLAGCTSSVVASVTVNTGPPSNILSTSSYTVSQGSSFYLNLGSTGDTYTTTAPYTSYNATGKYFICGPITASSAQVYSVTGTNICGTSTVTFEVVPVITSTINQGQFWGMTYQGGDYNGGTIYTTDASGNNHHVEYSFPVYDGIGGVHSLVQLSNGKYYGSTYTGGINNHGTLFEYDPTTNIYLKKFDFDRTPSGINPMGALLQAADGMIYGTTSQGGIYDEGVLFQFDPVTGIYTKKLDFSTAVTGGGPNGSLVQDTDGKIYGTTTFGGASGGGVIFQFDPITNVFTKKVDFNSTNGSSPNGSLLKFSDGMFYGTTNQGGANSLGIIFQYDPLNNILTTKHDFVNSTGSAPKSALMQASDGKLYSTTVNGGANNGGVIYQYDPVSNTYINKYDLYNASVDGLQPEYTLSQGFDGKLYGVTFYGGLNNLGIMFQYDPSTATCVKKMDFTAASGRTRSLMKQAPDGKFYYFAEGGVAGRIVQYDPVTNISVTKIEFNTGPNGKNPTGKLTRANNGKFYGMTPLGGVNNLGVLFEYDPVTHTFSKKIDFAGSTNGSKPNGSLLLASDGKLYGMTELGGTSNQGVLFQYDPITNAYSKKIDFVAATKGSSPKGTLMQASDGKLYGMTYGGGANNKGTLFQYDLTTQVLTKKIDFAGANGQDAYADLLEAADGKFYGMTLSGGNYLGSGGTLFQYDPGSNTLVRKVDLSNLAINGFAPYSSLTLANDGKLYGLTSLGGANNSGVLFQYDIATDAYTIKKDFNLISDGGSPMSTLLAASNGKLYGTTRQGGSSARGVVYEYDPATSMFTNKVNFNSANGDISYGSLIEIGVAVTTSSVSNSTQCIGSSIPVQYSLSGSFNAGNVFTAQLSDINGSFSSPTTIGSVASATPTIINATIPASITSGTGYRIRVVSSSPSVIGSDNGVNLTFSVLPIPTITVNSGTVCSAQSFTLMPSGGVSYNFLNGSSVVTPSVTATYTVIGTDVNGCSSSAISSVSVLTPSITLNSGTICFGQTFTFTPTGAVSYTYSSGSAVVSPTVTSTYTVTGLDINGCIGSAANYVTVIANPIINATASNSVNCLVATTTLTAFGATSYTWMPGALTGNTIVTSPTVTTIYTVTGNSGSCSNTKTLSVNVTGAVASLTTSVSNSITCGSSSVTLTALGATSYTWNPGALTGSSVIVSPTVTTTYSLTGSTGACISTKTLVVTVIPTPTISVNGGSICNGQSFSITPSGASSYTYSGGSSVVTPTISTTYTVTGSSGSSCIDTKALTVIVNPLPTLTVTGTNTVCLGTSSGFIANGAMTYTWSTAQNTSSISVNPNTTTTYTVWGANINGCVNSQTVSVIVNNTCADVWPGDANSDGVADNLDVLELGLHYTQTGAPRASVSNNWQSYFANNWIGTITNGSNLNHSDCNGDGTINDDDTLAIYNNYGLTHAFKSVQTNTVNTQLSIVPDQAMVVKGNWGTASVYLGDATSQINNINGIAFTVDFDNTLIEPNSIWIEYISSFIDASNLYFRKLDFANSKLFTASTHTVSNNVSGYGKIATLHYQIKSSLSTDEVLNLSLSYANQSSATGSITPLSTGTGTLMAIGASVGLKENNFSGNVLISPNPTNGLLNIRFNSIPQNTKIELYNSIGALVLSETMSDKNNAINVSVLSSGIYFMKVIEGNKVVAVKKLVRE